MAQHFTTMATPDWGSPDYIAAAARAYMAGIDLDPASSANRNLVIGANRFLGETDKDPAFGIPTDWGTAQRIFINPPGGVRPDRYTADGKPTGPTLASLFWMALAGHVEDNPGAVFVWVAYNINQLQTLQQVDAGLLAKCCVCIPNTRVKYLDPEANPRSGTPSASAILGYVPQGRPTRYTPGLYVGDPELRPQQAHLLKASYAARFQHAFKDVGLVWKAE